MNIKLFFIGLFFISSVYAETVYKTRDAEGNVIFSDVFSEGSEVIEIKDAQTLHIPEVSTSKNRRTIKLVPKEVEYTQLKIINPQNDATIHSNEGIVTINIEMTPALDEKHLIVLSLDGKEVESGSALEFALAGLDRGMHAVNVAVKNEKGKILKHSGKLVFHLRKKFKFFKNQTNGGSDATN